jgi:hypothetical protein
MPITITGAAKHDLFVEGHADAGVHGACEDGDAAGDGEVHDGGDLGAVGDAGAG